MKPTSRFAASTIFIAFGLGASANAQVTLTQGDNVGQSSWAFGGRWSDGLAPSASKHYVNNVSERLLRTPDNVAGSVFAGGSLTISNGAALVLKTSHNSTNTIFDLRLDSGGFVRIVDNGRTVTLDGNMNILSGGGVLQPTTNANLILGAAVTGSGPLTKINVGTVTLNGNCSGYTGTMGLDGGTTQFNTSFGGNIAVNAATARFQNGVTVGGTLTGGASSTIAGKPVVTGNIALNGGTLAVNATTPGNLTTAGDLTLSGITTLNLSEGLPTSAGTFTVIGYAGTLAGTAANFQVAGAANYRNPVVSVDTPQMVTVSVGSETRTWTGENGTLWDINTSQNWLEGDKLFLQMDSVHFGNTGAGDVIVTGVLSPSSITIDSSADYNFIATTGNVIAGAGSLTKTGTGTATIGGANTFSGGITVSQGILRGGSASQSFGANGQVITVENGATLDFNDSNTANRDFQCTIIGTGVGGMGAVVNNAGSGRTFGLGSLTLAGNATIGGSFQWDVRPISAANNPASLDLAGFTLTKTGASNVNLADIVISADGIINIDGGSITFSRGQVSGAGAFNVGTGAALRFVNHSSGSFTKDINLAQGSTFSNAGANLTLGSQVTISGDTTLTATNNTLIFAHPFTGTGDIVKTGAGTMIMPAPLQYDGALTLSEGMLALATNDTTHNLDMAARQVTGTNASTLAFGGGGSNPATVYTVSNGNDFQGNFRVLSGIFRISEAANVGSLAPDPLDPENATLPKTITMIARDSGFHLDGGGGNINLPAGYNFVISNDVPAVPAIANLAGNNTLDGIINISTGGGGGAISVFEGSLTLTGDISNVSTTRSVILGGTNGTGTVSGSIFNGSNTLGLDKNGPNTWVLTGDNFYSGVTTINEGTLQIGDGGESGTLGFGDVVNNGSLVIHRDGGINLDGVISGNGSLTHSGPAFTVALSANTYTGDTIVSDGTLSLSHPSLNDDSTIRLSGNGTLELYHGMTDTVKSLVIDNVVQSAGLWGRIGSISELGADFESALIAEDGLLNVTTGGSVATPFEEWAAALNLPAGKDGPGDDADSDNLSNLQEFAFDGDPLSGAGDGKRVVRIATVGGVPALTLTLPVRNAVGAFSGPDAISATGDGITYRIEGSGGLDSWTLAISEVTGPDATTIQSGLPALNTGWIYRTFRTPGPVTASAREFIRAGVE